jgi:hypothetical protein
MTNKRRTTLKIAFQECESPRNFYLAEEVVAQVNELDEICNVWIDNITDDLAGQEIAAFRKQLRKIAKVEDS